MKSHKSIYKKNWPILMLVFTVTLVQLSCTKNFDKYNTNPSGITSDLLGNDNVGVGAFFPQMQENVVRNAPNTGDGSAYQVVTNLNADLYSGYDGTPTPFSGGQNNSNYKLVDGWDNSAFSSPYNLMSAWLQTKKSVGTTHPDLYALANIIKVAGMHRLTDKFGPVPYSAYGAGGFEVNYDSQQAIYTSFFSQLDSAITTLTAYVQQNPTATPAINFDLVYRGNYIEWIKFANSLKLRLAMHIVYADPGLAQKEAESAISNSYGVLTANTDNAFVSSNSTVTIVNALWVINGNYGDIRAGAVLQSFLSGYKDPRISSYIQPSTQFPGQYIGIRNGIDIANKNDRVGFSQLNITEYQPIHWMTASEVYFLRAEGALRGWAMGGTAKSFYETGIQTSFDQWGVVGATGYIADATSTAAPYVDPVNSANNVSAGSAILSTVKIAWNDNDAFETNLERIITQKYIAMFPDGEEAWTEFRRTRYPKIWPVVVNYSGGKIDTQTQIRRLAYPASEYATNSTAVQQAVGLLGGADNGGTKLWWDKKP
jgi:hypothetical protein